MRDALIGFNSRSTLLDCQSWTEDAAFYLAKASESLQTADSEFASGRYDSCANRCYCACFQAAIAALFREGMRASGSKWGHDFVQAQFVGQLINRQKRYSGDLRQVLSDNRTLQDQADYGSKHITLTQASRALGKSRTFVTAVQQRSETDG